MAVSVQATTWVWEHSASKTGTRLVALAIADAANREGLMSCQSVPTIAVMTGLSERAVYRALNWLKDAGEIAPRGVHPRYGTTVYDMLMPVAGGDTADADPCQFVREGVTSASQTPVNLSPDPSSTPKGLPQETPPASDDAITERPVMTDAFAADEPLDLGLPTPVPPKNGATLVARWVEGHRSTGEVDAPGPFMKRVVGQCGRLARECGDNNDDWRAAWVAAYAAGEQGRVDPVPLMVKARSQFERRSNLFAVQAQKDASAGLLDDYLGIDTTPRLGELQ